MSMYLKILGGGGCEEYKYKGVPKLPTSPSDLDLDLDASIEQTTTIILLADSTPSGCLQCVQFINEVLSYQRRHGQRRRFKFMRVKIPYTANHYMSSDAFLDPEFDPSCARILGRIRWLAADASGDFGSYDLEHIEVDDGDAAATAAVDWPVPYLPKLSHLKANGMYGNSPFLLPQLLSGLSYFQQFALERYAQQQQTTVFGKHECTAHELACLGVSRLGDIPIPILVKQVMDMASSDTKGPLDTFRPKIWTLEEYERFPMHLVTPDGRRDNVRHIYAWLVDRCDRNGPSSQSSPPPPPPHAVPGTLMMAGKTKFVRADLDLVGLLEEWFQLKIQAILAEKKARVEAWMDSSSRLFRERQYLRSLFIPNEHTKRFFFSATEAMKKELLEKQFQGESEEWINHLLHLPIKRIGPEVFEFLTHDGPSAKGGDGDDSADAVDGFTAYTQKTARQLLKESLQKLPFATNESPRQ